MTIQITTSATKTPTTLTKASEQWRTRPADQRFETLADLMRATTLHRENAMIGESFVNALTVEAVDGAVMVVGANGNRAVPNNWAFGQLCQRAGAPAGYLRTLPTHMAAANLAHGLAHTDDARKACLLLERQPANGSGAALPELRAITSDTYRRVWNCEVADALIGLQERQPAWQFPEPFRTVGGRKAQTWGDCEAGKQVPVAYASDRDMFVFMCDYEHGVTVDGNTLARGFFVENSEVGDASFRITMFLFDFVCSNILVWGARNVVEVRMNHVGRIRDRVLDRDSEVLASLRAYAQLPASVQEEQIRMARATLLGDKPEDVLATLFGRKALGLTKTDIQAAQTVAAQTPRYGDPRTVWAMANGLTEVSQREKHADARIRLDRAAGAVLQTFAF